MQTRTSNQAELGSILTRQILKHALTELIFTVITTCMHILDL